jgi:hypothetical protein
LEEASSVLESSITDGVDSRLKLSHLERQPCHVGPRNNPYTFFQADSKTEKHLRALGPIHLLIQSNAPVPFDTALSGTLSYDGLAYPSKAGSIMDNPPVYSWHPAYLSAVLETANERMPGRIYEALAAIEQRRLNPIETGGIEYREMENAERGLLTLRAERVGGGRAPAGAGVNHAGQHSEETC